MIAQHSSSKGFDSILDVMKMPRLVVILLVPFVHLTICDSLMIFHDLLVSFINSPKRNAMLSIIVDVRCSLGENRHPLGQNPKIMLIKSKDNILHSGVQLEHE